VAFTECLVAARVSALSFFVHIRSPLQCEENEQEQKRDRKKSSKQGGDGDEEGNMRLIRIASEKKKREVISRPLGMVSGKAHFFKIPVSQF
jgi:hypothetical protein